MISEFLLPVSIELRAFSAQLDTFSIGSSLRFDEEIQEKSIVIFGIKESRGGDSDYNSEIDFDFVRRQFYQLKKGNWHLPIYDLGDLNAGSELEDTYFAALKIQEELLKKKCTLLILGGTSDFAYWQYRAFDSVTHTVNLTSIDNRFRLGNDISELSSENYLSKIITKEPQQLFDYTHLGHQTYFVAQEELDLMEHLNFEVKRLGKLTESISEAEPELRNSNLVVMNLDAVQYSDFRSNKESSANGFNSREICALARYSGRNNKTQSFGVYNYKAKNILVDDMLLAEILWYFIEGKNYAPEKLEFKGEEGYETYYVQMKEQDLIFYHDVNAQQWWMELSSADEKNRQYVIPCSFKDYETALSGQIPNRWWKSYKKLY